MSCPTNPPPPSGFRIWRGPVPQPLVDWAVSLRDRINTFDYGSVFELPYNGVTAVARKDHHTYTYRGGQLVTGLCLPGITLYQPIPTTAGAIATDDTAPDPTAAMFTAGDAPTNWGLVAVSGIAVVGVVGLFLLALRAAPKPRPKPRWRHRIPRAY